MSFIYKSRKEIFENLFGGTEKYRFSQVEEAIYAKNVESFLNITNLSKEMREKMDSSISFFSFTDSKVLKSKDGSSYKALLTMQDNKGVETVLMRNARDEFTVCLSSEIGCPINCFFCATGKMGFIRNLHSDEILDQYRFWLRFIIKENLQGRILNLVFMGMGEPLLNYDNVKDAINIILKYTGIGETRITLSTAVVFPQLYKIIEDESFPSVRIAVSLHSADFKTRKRLIPNTDKDFFKMLLKWANEYLKERGGRRHYLTFEYVMLDKINDSQEQAERLVRFLKAIPDVKVNLVPYNETKGELRRSKEENILRFKQHLEKNKVVVTIRKSMGEDIKAACGQLVS